MNESLLQRTYRLLDASDLTIREIADGAGINFHWLGKFKQKAFKDPGVTRVERLHQFLADRSDAAAA